MGELVKFEDSRRDPPAPEIWEKLKELALTSVRSPHSKRSYGGALDDWRKWHLAERPPAPFWSKAGVAGYRSHLEGRGLSPASINVRLSAIRRLTAEMADNGLLPQELATTISRVKGTARHGVRLGNWLTKEQAEVLLDAPAADTITGKRDRALLGVLIGCGLRRSEACALTFEHIQQREGRWVIVDLVGKHGRVRTVPMPSFVKARVDVWTSAGSITSGCVFRGINRGGRITTDAITNSQGVWVALKKYCAVLGLPGTIAPHDLRRTCAKLCRTGGGDLEQIQQLMGHASIQTTEKYLGTHQNLTDAPNDHLGLRVA